VTLPDTSAWIEYLRGTGSGVHLRLRELVTSGGPIAVTEPVEMEVLVGARTARLRREQRELLRSFNWLPFVTATDFEGAVQLYERCRSEGITPRGMVDCMIAAVAMRHDVVLLTADRDLARIAEVMALRLDPASIQPWT
jgi:predicted nucleic acid-binding protein